MHWPLLAIHGMVYNVGEGLLRKIAQDLISSIVPPPFFSYHYNYQIGMAHTAANWVLWKVHFHSLLPKMGKIMARLRF